MSEKFQNKYRIPSARAAWWDYSADGIYFITICTQNREHYFGEIIKGKMQLSNIGVLADVLWHEIKHHARNIELGAFVVMPNHIHGILILNGNTPVETLHATSLQNANGKNEQMSMISPKQNSISTIIRSYKSAVVKHAHRLGCDFAWQSRFYDNIIRNQQSYNNVSNYIVNNPVNWQSDNFFQSL